MKIAKLSLRLTASLPEGLPLTSYAGVQGRLVHRDDGLELALTADWSRPVAELRWQVDQLVRRARRLLDLREAEVEIVGEAPSAPLREGLLLDLRRAFSSVAGLSDEARRYGATEDLFRRWVNEDPGVRTSHAICNDVLELAGVRDGGEVVCEVLDEARLEALGLNLLLAVGRASESSPPRLAIARWLPAGRQDERPLMLLGKGITFDTGGINVKPYESFVSHMRNDMAGAGLVFAAFKHLVDLGYPRPLLLVIPTCENAIGERAVRPGSVVRSHRGLRVKIDHTDAEGRLILADALSYAEDRFEPALTLCFATLTTAALQAYGPYTTPVHFATASVEAALHAASARTGEDLHFLPRRAWHFEANRDDEADLKNTARLPGYLPASAGSRNAAHFFLHFARQPFVHSDIFASTWNWGGDHPGTGFGATGAPLRTFLLALEDLAGS
jgi:leucyl aminopeptidase